MINGCMRDCEGNIIKCKCGNPYGSAVIGKESYVAWYEECSPNKDAPVAQFVYRPPDTTDSRFEKCKKILESFPILDMKT
jgi:hypothetical protein